MRRLRFQYLSVSCVKAVAGKSDVRLSISRKNCECPEFREELMLLCLKLE